MMSFIEMLEGVKLLTLEEKQQLRDALVEAPPLKEDLDNWFRPGMTGFITPKLTTDEDGLRIMMGVAQSEDAE